MAETLKQVRTERDWFAHDKERLLKALGEVKFVADRCSKCRPCADAIVDIVRSAYETQQNFDRARLGGQPLAPESSQ